MATKYVDTSLGTGLNDGTSTANAWQSLVDVLDGTPSAGSYAAGDTIIIRTADGGGDLSETASSAISVPSKSGAETNYVEWRFDDGTVWAQSGTFKLSFTGSADWTVDAGNWFNGGLTWKTYLFEIEANGTSDQDFLHKERTSFCGVHFTRGTNPGASAESRIQTTPTDSGSSDYQNCKFETTTAKGGGTDPTLGGIIEIAGNPELNFDGCIFALNSSIALDGIIAAMTTTASSIIRVFNSEITGTASTHFIALNAIVWRTIRPTTWHFNNVIMGLIDVETFVADYTATANGVYDLIFENINGEGGYMRITPYEWTEYDPAGNFPYLNATIPDSGTGWSVRCFPEQNIVKNVLRPARLGSFSKWYNGAEETKDIRLELLIRDTSADTNAYDSPQKDEWWMTIGYIDADTDEMVWANSRVSGALATSTASWSATTYGGDTYDKYKIVLTTAEPIKQYTFVQVRLYSNQPAGGTSDFYFIDPDFQIE